MSDVQSHVHAPTHAQKHLEVWQFACANQTFDKKFLQYNYLCLIRICANPYVTIKQTAVQIIKLKLHS